MKTIEIIVTATGFISIDAVGFKGADCNQATRFLEQALGESTRNVNKPEYYQQVVHQNRQELGS